MIAIALCWVYFDSVSHRLPRRSTAMVSLWFCLHLPLTMGIASVGAAVLNVVEHAGEHLPPEVRWLLVGAIAVTLVSIAVLTRTIQLSPEHQRTHRAGAGVMLLSTLLITFLGFSSLDRAIAEINEGAVRVSPGDVSEGDDQLDLLALLIDDDRQGAEFRQRIAHSHGGEVAGAGREDPLAVEVAEIGDIQRFPSADQLVAFCGLALSEAQSGQARSRRFLSRRGSAHLRGAFFQAALVAVKFDPQLAAYYQRRTRQGLANRSAILAVARKLVRISYALLKSGQPYQASRPSSE